MAAILVIEDDDALREMLRVQLEYAGHDVRVAVDGREGVAVYRAESIDVVITDLFMPDTDGFAVMNKIRRIDPRARIIATSGAMPDHSDELLEAAAGLGAVATLRKPFRRQQLLDTLERVLPPPADSVQI